MISIDQGVATAPPALLVERDAGVAIVTLNRPEKMNALNPEMVVRLRDIWREVREEEAIYAVLITGAGTRAFSAGGDLKELVPLTTGRRPAENEWDERLLSQPGILNDALLRNYDVDRPVVAAVNGLAMGGGMELLQGADIRLACPSAVFGQPEVTHGLFPAGGSTVNLPRQIPRALAMELLLTGASIDASRARDIGFVNAIHESDKLLEEALAIARRIASFSPTAVQAIRRSVREAEVQPRTVAMDTETRFATPVFSSAAAAEGLRDFADRSK